MRRAVALICAVAAVLVGAAPAGADVFGPISLVSQGTLPGGRESQQVDYAHDPAISGNGRYVAFDGSFGGVAGVWRRDLQTGEVQPVAVGAQVEGTESCVKELSGAETPCDSALPSISESGQYVSFTSTALLAPHEDKNKGPDVYVRNMNIAESAQQSKACEEEEQEATGPTESCPFALVSAVNGKSEGLTYGYTGGSQQFEEEHYGSLASGRSAISANGQEVAFVTTAISNLLRYPKAEIEEEEKGETPKPHTPALQVAVRNLHTRETQLVSVADDPETGDPAVNPETNGPEAVSGVEGSTTYGAVYNPGTTPPAFPISKAYKMATPVGASISADASTVAWMGQNVTEQAKLLSGETLNVIYAEPLWRRIVDGPQAPTRRITGGSDPAAPACIASGETVASGKSSDPCQGPFEDDPWGLWAGGIGNVVPQLSADGYTVAFLSRAGLVARGSNFGVGPGEAPGDLYVVDMHEGLTRVQALSALTEFASGKSNNLAENASIVDLGISPDGTQVAFTTDRTQFPLSSPAYVTAPAAVPGLLELFDVDLSDETLTRVTHGYLGPDEASEQPHNEVQAGIDPYGVEAGALSPSFSDNGDTLAFSSTASNLVYGDGNTPLNHEGSVTFDGSDAFVVERKTFPFIATPQYISQAPATGAAPEWQLGVTALSRSNGSVILYVDVPGAGTLHAGARSSVLVKAVARTGTAKSRKGQASRARTLKVRARETVATRTVSTSTKLIPAGGEVVELVLKLSKPYAQLAARSGGLSANVTLTFTASGHPALQQSLQATFLEIAHPARKRTTRRKKARR